MKDCTIRKKETCHRIALVLVTTVMVALSGCRSMSHVSETASISGVQGGPHSPFPTFKETDHELCTDERGRPLILLFSASSCSHCQWVGGVFDLIARKYAEQELVAAHHYDIETGDDLLTEAVESRIPEKYLSIGKRGDPEGYLPYFNFGCRYDRIGTGYEEQDDLAAEAEEMCAVIEALLP